MLEGMGLYEQAAAVARRGLAAAREYGLARSFGVILVISPGDRTQVFSVAYLTIASFAVALGRAWSLVQGKHLRPGASAAADK